MPNPNYPAGSYVIIGSDNLPVSKSQWEAYGGAVSVAINPDVPGAIDVTLIGPSREIPGIASPYSLAVSDGSTAYPVFSVTGAGVFTNPETVAILSGSNPDKTSQDVALTVDNIFIDTLERAYDRGIWATEIASGPQITLKMTVPTSAIGSFGASAGSRIRFKDSTYRIISLSVEKATTAITAVRHVTVADVDAIWASQTVGDFDAAWGARDLSDFKVKPLLAE